MTILDRAEATQERVLTAAMGREPDPANSVEAGPVR